MACKGCGDKDPNARPPTTPGELYEVTLPKIVEPKVEDIPTLPDAAIAKALDAVARRGDGFEPARSIVFVQGHRRADDGPVTFRAAILGKATALKILGAQPVLAAKVLARHTELFELEEGTTGRANAVYVGTGGAVAFERFEFRRA